MPPLVVVFTYFRWLYFCCESGDWLRGQQHEVGSERRHHIIRDNIKQVKDISDLGRDVANANPSLEIIFANEK